jgi:hypothetical protein
LQALFQLLGQFGLAIGIGADLRLHRIHALVDGAGLSAASTGLME